MGEYMTTSQFLTVEELIQELRKLPQDADVYVYGSCGAGDYGGRHVYIKYIEGRFCEEGIPQVEIWGNG